MDKIITAEMMDNLFYDSLGNPVAMRPNHLKKIKVEELLAVVTLDHSLEEATKRIQENIATLASLEAEDNCIPYKIVEDNIKKALKLMNLTDVQIPAENLPQEAQGPTFYARVLSHHSISSIFRTIFFTLSGKFAQLCIAYDAPRRRLIEFLLLGLLKCDKVVSESFEIPEEPYESESSLYYAMFVFQSSDDDAAIYNLVKSFEDPTNEFNIKTVYVQESCVERFCKKLERQLRPYPRELSRDEVFVERYNKMKEILCRLKASTLEPLNTTEKFVPVICLEFDTSYFPDLSPIVVIKTFRTVKEAINLAKQDKYTGATIWTTNFSIAYEIVNDLNLDYFWINCLGIESKMFKTINLLENIAGFENAFKAIATSGVSIENNFHFEYFLVGKICKRIAFPFGVTFAN